MKNADIFQACFENVCKNYNIPAGLRISEAVRDRVWHDLLYVFIDVHTASCANFNETEIWKNLSETGIKSKKDYRELRSLIRIRLIDAIRGMRDIAEESLRNLGVKV